MRTRVQFKLEQDEDGYPPASIETMWCEQVDDTRFRVLNTPLFAQSVSSHDIITVESRGDRLFAKSVVESGGHSTIRVFLRQSTIDVIEPLRERWRCSWEYNPDFVNVAAVDIPPEVDFGEIHAWLTELERADDIGTEYSCLTDLHARQAGYCPHDAT